MNSLAHTLLSYLIARHFTSDPYLLIAAMILGNLPDLDHLSHLGKALKTGRFGSVSRSRFHELYGLGILSALFSPLAYIQPNLSFLYFPLLGHYLADFLTRPTRPFYPYDAAEMHGRLYPRSLPWMTAADIIVTGLLIIGVLL